MKKKKWKKDLLIILPVKNTVFHKFVVQLSSFYGVEFFSFFFSFLVRNSILFLVSHEKFKPEKNATCISNLYTSSRKFVSWYLFSLKWRFEIKLAFQMQFSYFVLFWYFSPMWNQEEIEIRLCRMHIYLNLCINWKLTFLFLDTLENHLLKC